MRFSKAILPAVLSVAGLLQVTAAHAALDVNSGSYTYSETFDSLTQSTSSTTWANDSTLAGWSLFTVTSATSSTPKVVTNYYGGTGSSTTGAFYSFGSASSSDRALGGLGSGGAYFGSPTTGNVAGWISVAFTNNTGSSLSGFDIKFDGEQWRNGAGTNTAAQQIQSMVLQYGFGTTFDAVTTWNTPGGNFDWTAPVTTTGTAAAVDGNVAGLVTNRGGSVTTSWDNGQTLWVRWVENNDAGNDHGLAIDNLSFSVAAVPEPETYAMLLAGLGLLGGIARRRAK